MATLDRVMQMQSQGMTDDQISQALMREGVSPREINDSLGQAKVKSAVDDSNGPPQGQMQGSIMPGGSGQQPQPGVPQMSPQQAAAQAQEQQAQFQQGQMQQQPQQDRSQQTDTSQYPQGQMQAPDPNDPNQQQYYDQNYYAQTPQAYDDQGYYPQGGGYDTDTIAEIAEQVVNEKFDEFRKKTGDLSSFKNETKDTLREMEKRLDKLEDSMEKLQQAIIGKIGEFGEDAAMIRKEIGGMHDTMGKLMNPLVDNYNEMKKARVYKS